MPVGFEQNWTGVLGGVAAGCIRGESAALDEDVCVLVSREDGESTSCGDHAVDVYNGCGLSICRCHVPIHVLQKTAANQSDSSTEPELQRRARVVPENPAQIVTGPQTCHTHLKTQFSKVTSDESLKNTFEVTGPHPSKRRPRNETFVESQTNRLLYRRPCSSPHLITAAPSFTASNRMFALATIPTHSGSERGHIHTAHHARPTHQ